MPALKEAGKATPKPLNKQLEAPPSLPPLQQRAKIPNESLLAINRGISVAGAPFKIAPDATKSPAKQTSPPAEPPKTQPKSNIPEMRGDASRLTNVKSAEMLEAEEKAREIELEQMRIDEIKGMRAVIKELPKAISARASKKEESDKQKTLRSQRLLKEMVELMLLQREIANREFRNALRTTAARN